MQNWRRVTRTILIAIPLLILLTLFLLGVLLGSLGIDIHFTSKPAGYIVTCCFVAIICACPVIGIKLRRAANSQEGKQ